MENKKLLQQEFELIEKLLNVVNSEEEFNYLLNEREKVLAQLSSHIIERRYKD